MELAKALDIRLLLARPGYFFPAHPGQRQNWQNSVGRCLDTIPGPSFTSTSSGVPAGKLGSFPVETAKGSFPDIGPANNSQIKRLLKNLQKR